MEDRDQTSPSRPPQPREYTCPTCQRRVRILQQDPSKLPRYFPFCSERCKRIDLGAWLDAEYRIPSKPDDESDHPSPADSPADSADARP